MVLEPPLDSTPPTLIYSLIHRFRLKFVAEKSDKSMRADILNSCARCYTNSLFSNGMKESDQMRPTIIRIADSEENALMELLSFMYSGKLTSARPTLLLDILIAADKFEHRDELIDMPLSAIEAIFLSNDINVKTEDGIYSFLLEWARKQYPDSEERHKVWSSRLLPLVRFSHMSWKKLHQVLACSDDDIDHEQTTKRITNMLLHKAYPAHHQVVLAAEATACWQVPQRAYRFKRLKVIEFDRPCPHIIVYLDLTREECSRLFPKGEIFSHLFHLAGQNFCLT
uniref:Uncharacterized protein n=1 Tax=Aegilops tauschii TaxID=37682 RepID=N1R352_AEGTA